MLQGVYNGVKQVGAAVQSPLLLLIRVYWGYQFAIAGVGKLQQLDSTAAFFQTLHIPFPATNAIMAGSTEMIGGLLFFFGLFSRIISIPLFFVMLVAYLTAGLDALTPLLTQLDPEPFLSASPFLFLYAAVLIFSFGPGKISIDYWLTGAYKNKEMP